MSRVYYLLIAVILFEWYPKDSPCRQNERAFNAFDVQLILISFMTWLTDLKRQIYKQFEHKVRENAPDRGAAVKDDSSPSFQTTRAHCSACIGLTGGV